MMVGTQDRKFCVHYANNLVVLKFGFGIMCLGTLFTALKIASKAFKKCLTRVVYAQATHNVRRGLFFVHFVLLNDIFKCNILLKAFGTTRWKICRTSTYWT